MQWSLHTLTFEQPLLRFSMTSWQSPTNQDMIKQHLYGFTLRHISWRCPHDQMLRHELAIPAWFKRPGQIYVRAGIALPNVFRRKDQCGATRRVRRIAMTLCMDWQIGGDPHCTALTFNYDFLGDAITHQRLDLQKLHDQTMPVCTVDWNFFLAFSQFFYFFFIWLV